MSSSVILNSTNRVAPHRFEYTLPTNVKFDSHKVAIQSISLYNSIFNIEKQRNNTQVKFTWNADTSTEHTWTFPDGFYSVSDINFFIFSEMVKENLYALDSNGNHVYFCEIQTSPTVYACQLTLYALPTQAEADALQLTIPAGATWSWPNASTTPQLTILTQSFGNLLGFTAATYPAVPQSTTTQFLSDRIPQISPVNSIMVATNLCQSGYSNPSDIIHAIPIKSGFGSLITDTQSNPIYHQIVPATYSKIVIEFRSQEDYSALRLHDPEVVIILSIARTA